MQYKCGIWWQKYCVKHNKGCRKKFPVTNTWPTNQVSICINHSHALINRNKTSLCLHINLQSCQDRPSLIYFGTDKVKIHSMYRNSRTMYEQQNRNTRTIRWFGKKFIIYYKIGYQMHTFSSPRPFVNGALPVAINAASTYIKQCYLLTDSSYLTLLNEKSQIWWV